jgi:hypothetical protein
VFLSHHACISISSYLLKQLPSFHKTWYEYRVTNGHPLNFIHFYFLPSVIRSWDTVASIAMGWATNGSEFRVPVQSRIFSSPCRLDRFGGPLSLLSSGYGGGVKWQECEADHSPPTSAEVKQMWIYTSTPTYAFMA